ncbi:MAG TPA: SLC13 family permease [Woeseiaceae bacterium]|nr:SLC13 family permease [Woeseiaceae bacterium]
MTSEILFVAAVIAIAAMLILSGSARLDIVALLVVLSLILGKVLTPQEALLGFGDPVVITVAGLLIISEMLTRTGVAHFVGGLLVKYGRNGELQLILVLTALVAALGAVMSNTAIVAIFLPIVLAVTRRTNLNASRLLLPLAYASLVSGMLTLISTTPNIVLATALERAGFDPFDFFSFTPIGLAVMGAFAIYMSLIGRHLLPGDPVSPPETIARTFRELLVEFNLMGTSRRAEISAASPLAGQTLATGDISSRFNVRVIMIERIGHFGKEIFATPPAEFRMRAGDILVLHGAPEDIDKLSKDCRLLLRAVTDADRTRWTRVAGIAKVLVHPESSLIGSTIRKIGLRSSSGVEVLAVTRKNEVLEDFMDRSLKSGDSMLVIGSWKRIRLLQSKLHDFVVLAFPAEIEDIAPTRQRAPIALAILALMVALSAFELVPVVVAVLIATLLAVLTRCLSMEDAYDAVHWNTIVLIAGMMSVSRALDKTGSTDLMVAQLIDWFSAAGPYMMMSALFMLTALLSMVLSNTATAVLLAPVAINTATALGVSPYAFAMTVAIAASAGFLSPVSSPAVMLVMGPGKYRIADFMKLGIPMLIISWLITILVTPLLFPFDPSS